MGKILGLDLGTNSIGWAIVEREGETFSLKDKGVRIFQEGVKIEKGVEGSKAAERTKFRSARRIKFRRKLRKIELLKALTEFDYCPQLTEGDLKLWRYKKQYPLNKEFVEWWRTDDKTRKTPYFYRNKAVTEKLNLENREDRYVIGRAFYHIVQRRGFLSNRLEGKKETLGDVKKEIAGINEQKGEQTLGQFFYGKYLKGEKIRDTYTHREEHYLEEFNRICEFQNLPLELVAKVKKAIFYQRPLRSQKGLVGKCVFEKNRTRCSVSRPEFEEYRMLCFVNNIRIQTPDDEKMRPLGDSERQKITLLFQSKPYFDFEDLVKKLYPKKQYKYYKDRNKHPEDYLFNYTMNTTVSGCPVSAQFRDIFGDNFMDLSIPYLREKDGKESTIDISDVWHVLNTFDSDDKLKEFAQKKLGLKDEQIKKFVNISLKQEYASLSLNAIKKIVPYLRQGLIYSHAVFLANMHEAIPVEIWAKKENQDVINKEISTIIQEQNEDAQLVEIVNSIIKANKEGDTTWSDEAEKNYRQDIRNKLEHYYGEKTFNAFCSTKRCDMIEKSFALLKKQMQKSMEAGKFLQVKTIEERVKDFIKGNFDVTESLLEKIYHPSVIETYKPAVKGEDGRLYLGSPMVASVKNPMAMRSLHQLRKVVNELIRKDLIDASTKINIEMARELMNANERKAYKRWQEKREKVRKQYAELIKEHYQTNNINLEPSDDDILKYQLWEEQNHQCVYTGDEIGIANFLGANPSYDIEHTIPRSISFDNSQENKTLCQNHFNRAVKQNRMPAELDNHEEILRRIVGWEEKYLALDKEIEYAVRKAKGAADKEQKDRAIQERHQLVYEKKYWFNKYHRFVMTEVKEGFKNSQLVDTGIITKYSRLYLKTLFNKVYTVKGSTVADFRKLWGLQDEYAKKERVNHVHHCIDAITIACITKENYEALARFYHDAEDLYHKGVDQLPPVNKPWNTFTQDVKSIEKEILVSHYTPDVLKKQSKKILRVRGKKQYGKDGNPIYLRGDTVRGSLHKETFYGAIAQDVLNNNGEYEKQIKYVVRKPLDSLDDENVKNIVDKCVQDIVKVGRVKQKQLLKQIDDVKQKLKKADGGEKKFLEQEIANLQNEIAQIFVLKNKNGSPVPIKKVRVFQPMVTNPIFLKQQRDKSIKIKKEHKEYYYVANDDNYILGIYEVKNRDKIQRTFKSISNKEAGDVFKLSAKKTLNSENISANMSALFPPQIESQNKVFNLCGVLKAGTMVILWDKEPSEIWEGKDLSKRLYKVYGFRGDDGRVKLRYHFESRPDKDQDKPSSIIDFVNPQSKLILSLNKFNALIEGVDFKITSLGKIVQLNK